MTTETYPERFTNGSGQLELPANVTDDITVTSVDDADGPFDPEHQHDQKVIHDPTEISDEYTVSPMARNMNPNDLNETARRQLVRDHPEILEHYEN